MAYAPVDYVGLCRLCLSESGERILIFEDKTNDAVDISLPLKILSCVSIRVEKKDPYPLWICQQCKIKIDDIYKFRMLCKMSDAKLKSHHQILPAEKKNIEENEEIPHSATTDSGMSQRAIPNTFTKVSHTESIINIEQESIEDIVPEINVKQECEENFKKEDTSTEQIGENEDLGEDKTSMIEESSVFEVFSMETKQEKIEVEETEIEQPCIDYNQPVHLPLENESNGEDGSEIKKQCTQRTPDLSRLECPICRCLFTHDSTLARHVKTCKLRAAYGKYKPILPSRAAPIKHKEAYRIPAIFTCNTCKMSFERKRELSRHRTKNHSVQFNTSTQKYFMCDNCGLVFANREKLICHQAQNHGDYAENVSQQELFKCDDCSFIFTKKEELTCHQARYHRPLTFTRVYRKISGASNSSQNTTGEPYH